MRGSILGLMVSLVVFVGVADPAAATKIGPRAGATDGPGDFYVGLELETTANVGPARFAPSVDFEIGDADAIALNVDLRWDLLPIPDTGLAIYGKGGLTLFLTDGEDELGLALTPGLQIPMTGGRKLQVEIRFGFADTPDQKIGAAVLFDF